MSSREDVSPLTLNRLSVYLRCLRRLQELGEERAVLNFAPVRLIEAKGVHTRNVDLRIYLEEMVFYLGQTDADAT